MTRWLEVEFIEFLIVSLTFLEVVLLGSIQLFGIKIPQRRLKQWAEGVNILLLGLSLILLGWFFFGHALPSHVLVGELVHTELIDLPLDFAFTRGSCVYFALTQFILLVASRYSATYLHNESGLQRFRFLLGVCQLGVVLVLSASHLALIFVGWELVGLSSTLLIAFFFQHYSSANRSMRAFMSYRLSDVGLILAAALMHKVAHSDSLVEPEITSLLLSSSQALLIGLALIWGTLGKGGLFPFMTWMPSAMEGPTPSSAVFYGAISVHLAPLLLIRTLPLWQNQTVAVAFVFAIGLITASIAALVGLTQSNIKRRLAYAVTTQIGLMYVELSFGWTNLVMLHICGHALLRTYQFFSSADIVNLVESRTYLMQRNGPVIKQPVVLERWFIHLWNGLYLDMFVERLVVSPVLRMSHLCLNLFNRMILSLRGMR